MDEEADLRAGRDVVTSAQTARVRVYQAIDQFMERTDHDRLVLYRMHLQAHVRSISPLTFALAEHFDVDLAGGAALMRPSPDWPRRAPPPFGAMAHRSHTALRHLSPRHRSVPGMLQRYALNRGFCHFGEGADMLFFDVDGRWLSMQGRIGKCAVCVVKGVAALTLPAGLPDTVITAMPGRPVDAIISHPALAGRDYRVRRVREGVLGEGPTLFFGTGRRAFSMPWPELLASGHADPIDRLPPDARPGRDAHHYHSGGV